MRSRGSQCSSAERTAHWNEPPEAWGVLRERRPCGLRFNWTVPFSKTTPSPYDMPELPGARPPVSNLDVQIEVGKRPSETDSFANCTVILTKAISRPKLSGITSAVWR